MERLTGRIKKQVKDWAEHSLYRMNAKTADCYAFNLYKNDKGRLDFDGGWDWTNDLIDKNAEHIYIFGSQTFKRIKNE